MINNDIEPEKQLIQEIYDRASDDARIVAQLILKIEDESHTYPIKKISDEIRKTIKNDGD